MSNGWGGGGVRGGGPRHRNRNPNRDRGNTVTSSTSNGDGIIEHVVDDRRRWSASSNRRRNRPRDDRDHRVVDVSAVAAASTRMGTTTTASSGTTKGGLGGRDDHDLHRPSPSSVGTAMLDANRVDGQQRAGSRRRGHCRGHHRDGDDHDDVDLGEVDAPEFAYRDHRHRQRGSDVGVDVDVDCESDDVASYDCGSDSSFLSDIDDDSSADDCDGDDADTPRPRRTTANANELLNLVCNREWDLAIRRAASHPGEVMARGHRSAGDDSDGHVPMMLPLHAACTLDPPLSVVRALLGTAGDDPRDAAAAAAEAVDRDGRTALHWACDAGGCSPAVVRELLDANPNAAKVQERTYGFLPLHIACFRDGGGEEEDDGGDGSDEEDDEGEDEDDLGDFGKELNDVASGGAKLARSRSSSRRVAARRAAEVVNDLLDAHPGGAAVADDVMGWLPLHVVCRTDVGGADVARSLLGVHPDAAMVRDRGSRLPLHWACCHRFDRYRRRRRRRRPLAGATETTGDARGSGGGTFDDALGEDDIGEEHGHEHDPAAELVRAVLESCPESSTKREKNYGFLPLHIACSSGASSQVVSALLSTNPDAARTRDGNESLPLHLACRADASQPVLLRLLGAHPDGARSQDADMRLPLHWACQVGASSSAIEALLGAFAGGAQTTEAKYGYLPLHVACKRGAGGDVVAALLAAHPEASRTRDDCGNLPIHIACGALAAGRRGGGGGGGGGGVTEVTEGVVGMLLLAFPESLEREDQQGRTPRMLAMDGFDDDHHHHHGDYSDVEGEEGGGDRRRPTGGGGGSSGRDAIIRMLSSEPKRWRRDLCSSSSLTSLVEAAASGLDGHPAPSAEEEDRAADGRPLAFLDGLSSSSPGMEKSSRLEHDLLAALRRHEDDMRNSLLCSSSTVDTGDEHDEDDECYGYHHGGRHDHHRHHQLRHLPSSSSCGDGELKYLDVESSWGSPPPATLPPRGYDDTVGDHEDKSGAAEWDANDDNDEHYHHHQIVVEVDDFHQGAAAEPGNGLTCISPGGDEWGVGNTEGGLGDDDDGVAEREERPVMCVLCLERPVSYILYPCGHPCLCETCARTHLSSLRNVCPVGRCSFRDAVRVYGRIVGSQ